MKFLLVEDDERIASSLTEALIDNNYVVYMASDGEKAWDLLTTFSYDLIKVVRLLLQAN